MTALDVPRTIRTTRWVAVLPAAASTLLVWALARAADVDLAVRSGGGTRTVGWPSVLVASTLATVAGLALLAYLEARRDRGRQLWTGIATGVFLASLVAGPASAFTVAAALVLAAMHAAVFAVLLGAAWWRR